MTDGGVRETRLQLSRMAWSAISPTGGHSAARPWHWLGSSGAAPVRRRTGEMGDAAAAQGRQEVRNILLRIRQDQRGLAQ